MATTEHFERDFDEQQANAISHSPAVARTVLPRRTDLLHGEFDTRNLEACAAF